MQLSCASESRHDCSFAPLLQLAHRHVLLWELQSVDLVDMLVRRGMKPAAAAAFLDTCPPLSASVWVKRGLHLRGAHLEGYAAVVLDKGRERGASRTEGEAAASICLMHTAAGQLRQIQVLRWSGAS